jgi:hypothetical protein
VYNIGKIQVKRLLGSPRRRWEDNIKIDLKEIVWKGVDCSHLAQDMGCDTTMQLRLASNAGNFPTNGSHYQLLKTDSATR